MDRTRRQPLQVPHLTLRSPPLRLAPRAAGHRVDLHYLEESMPRRPDDIGDLGTAPSILLQRAQEIPAEPAPIHLDLYTSDRDRHVARLLELGATRPEQWPYPNTHDFVVLRDPDGNEFCVIAV